MFPNSCLQPGHFTPSHTGIPHIRKLPIPPGLPLSSSSCKAGGGGHGSAPDLPSHAACCIRCGLFGSPIVILPDYLLNQFYIQFYSVVHSFTIKFFCISGGITYILITHEADFYSNKHRSQRLKYLAVFAEHRA